MKTQQGVKIMDRDDVKAILREAQEKLMRVGVLVKITQTQLPGYGKAVAMFAAETERDVYAGHVAMEDGTTEAHCNVKAFDAKVTFAVMNASSQELKSTSAVAKQAGDNAGTHAEDHEDKPTNQGVKWTRAADERLKTIWEYGEYTTTLETLAKEFARTETGIAARLVKLGLVPDRLTAERISNERKAVMNTQSADA